MRVLVACEFSGTVRDAFTARGHEAWSCDLLPTESYTPVVYAADLPECDCCGEPYCNVHENHYADCPCIGPAEDEMQYREQDGILEGARHLQCDVLSVLDRDWDLMIAFPPCTYLCSSGLHWNGRTPGRADRTEEALKFVAALLAAPIERIALENPVGCISTRIRKYDQVIQPWQFGHPESKTTCLWLKNLWPLTPTNILPRPECGYWSNQTPGRQNKLGPSETRWKERSKTYQGIANAMAEQWGSL